MRFVTCSLLSILLLGAVAQGDEPSDEIVYAQQIAPIFTKNCSACHNNKKSEGGLGLESFEALIRGGDSGPAVVAKDVDASELLRRVIAVDDSVMPPDDNAVDANRLDEGEIDLLKQWIAQGTKGPALSDSEPLEWRDVGSMNPVYASDFSPDGNYLAFGRGNSIVLVTDPVGDTPQQQTLTDPQLALPTGQRLNASHLDLIQSLAFSPDSQRLATGGFRCVKIWRRQTQYSELASQLPGGAKSLALSPGGRWLAMSSSSDEVVIYDVRSTSVVCQLTGHNSQVTLAAWGGEHTLFTSDNEGQILFWNLSPNSLPSTLTYSSSEPNSEPRVAEVNHLESEEIPFVDLIAISENRLCGARLDGKVSAWQRSDSDKTLSLEHAKLPENPPSFQSIADFDAFDSIAAIATIPAAAEPLQLVIAHTSGAIEIVNAASAAVLRNWEVGSPVQRIAVNHNGTRLATVGRSSPVTVWNLADGQLLATTQGDYTNGRVRETTERDTARQKSLIDRMAEILLELKKEVEKEIEAHNKAQEIRNTASAAMADKVKEIEAAAAAMITTQQAIDQEQLTIDEANKRIEAMTAELDAKRKAVEDLEKNRSEAEAELAQRDQALAAASDSLDRANLEISTQEQRIAAEQQRLTNHQQSLEAIQNQPAGSVVSVAFVPHHDWIVAASTDNKLNVFDANSGRSLADLQSSVEPATALWITSDQQLLACDSQTNYSWDLNLRWQLERTLGDPQESLLSDRITALDFSPDGQQLAIGSGPPSRFGDVKIFDLESHSVALDLGEVHSDTVLGVRYSPDGRQLATCAADKLCKLFDLSDGTFVRSFEGHAHHVLGVAWQDSGQLLATASADNSLKTWYASRGERQKSLGGFGKEVTAVSFVAQSDQIATACVDGHARLHDTNSGQVIRGFNADTPLYTVAVTRDGRYVAAAGQSGEMFVWKADDAQLIQKFDND